MDHITVFLVSDEESLCNWFEQLLQAKISTEMRSIKKIQRDRYFDEVEFKTNSRFIFVASKRGRCQLYTRNNSYSFSKEIDHAAKKTNISNVLIVVQWPDDTPNNLIHHQDIENVWKEGHQPDLKNFTNCLLTVKKGKMLNERQWEAIGKGLKIPINLSSCCDCPVHCQEKEGCCNFIRCLRFCSCCEICPGNRQRTETSPLLTE
eukprot:m.143303 g.143303  ORF g.143303 m.143303 type:complete len:205 (+) comp38383_c1_seq1:1084-1698(+)